MEDRIFRLLEFDKILSRISQMASTPNGRELINAISPCEDLESVLDLQKEMSEAIEYVLRYGSPPVAGINDIRTSLRRLDLGISINPGELLSIAGVLRACAALKEHDEKSKRAEMGCVSDSISRLYSNKRFEQRISMSIISEDEILDSASSQLRSIRRRIRELQDTIRNKLEETLRSGSAQKFIQEPIVTIRNDRYVIPVKQEYRNEVPGLVHDFSSSGATVYVEPMAVVEANNEIKRHLFKEQVEIERLLKEMSDEAREMLPQLQLNMELLAKLDFLLSKTRFCLDFNCMPPVIKKNGLMQIKKGRHPLLDRKSVVPIDFCIEQGFDTVVITGPNTGGKTVSLKTIGLLVLMAQSGLQIPAAEGTELRFFNEIYADIGDEQSIEQNLSTFSSHMKNIIGILHDSDDKSLVLLDELGAGTDPAEGSALGMAVLDELKEKGSFTVATTHSTEIKLYALSTQGVENACCEFDIETLRPTYRILTGIPGKSNAFAISSRLGLDESVIIKAREYMDKENIRFEDILLSLEKDRSRIENNKMETEKHRLAAESIRKELDEQKRKLSTQKENLLQEAREEAKCILENARGEVSELSKEIRNIRKQITADIIRSTPEALSAAMEDASAIAARISDGISGLEDSIKTGLLHKQNSISNGDTYEKAPPESLKVGDTVRILNLGMDGTVIELPEGGSFNHEAMVQAGIIKIMVPISNLRLKKLFSEAIKKPLIEPTFYQHIPRSSQISVELDLRGNTLADAIEATDKYLDDASIAGLSQIMIIHGKGTGALMSGIRSFLRNHPHVRTFRAGRYGEGDTGVTVVELK